MLVEHVNSFARCIVNSNAINCVMEKKLEDWQLEDAARLRRLFDEKAQKSQQAFGADHHIGTQGMVWQYLSAKRPLNLDALIKFADGLGVSAREISPTLWKKIESYFYSEAQDDEKTLLRLTDEQKKFLKLVERMDPAAKASWLAIGASLPSTDCADKGETKAATERPSGVEDRRKTDLGFNPERRHFYPAPNFPQKNEAQADRRRKKNG